MPRFRYTAYSPDGVREVGALDVATEAQAWDKLTSLGLTVVELLTDKEDARTAGLSWTLTRRISLSVQADIAEQLAVLSSARLTAPQIVEVVEKSATLPTVKRKFQRMGRLMADGASFPDAFAESGADLHPLFVSLARIGHTTGDPSSLMKSLSITLRRQQKIAAQVTGSLIYPLILVIGGVGILALMSLYLAPRLATIFTSVDRPVPLEMSVFIGAGEFLRNWWPGLLLTGLVVALLVPVLARQSRWKAVSLIRRLPVVGEVTRDAALSRLARSVQIMLAAGMPLAPTLRAAAAALPSDPLSQHFDLAGAAIEAGGNGRDTFAKASGIPTMFRELFAIGERTNTLPSVMDAIATALEDLTERKAQQAMTLLTPILTLFIGGGIAFLVHAVMSALLTVNDLAL
jgi:type II secretory pathway component PulF